MADSEHLQDLVRRLVALDEEAYQEFAMTFGPLLLRYFVRRGLPYFEAEDLAATCVTDIAMKARKFPGVGSFAAWVFKIAKNAFADYRKKAVRSVELAAEPEDRIEDEQWFDPEVAVEVQVVLANLPEHDRALVIGRALNGRPFKELAEELGLSEEAARVRYLRARRGLESRLIQSPAIQKKIERSRRIRYTA